MILRQDPFRFKIHDLGQVKINLNQDHSHRYKINDLARSGESARTLHPCPRAKGT